MSSTGTATRGLARAVTRVLSGLAVAIVLGIVGMHALSSYGSGMGGHQQDSYHSVQAPTEPTAGSVPVAASVDDLGHATGDMAMLCASMLTSAGALVLAVLALRQSPSRWGALPRPSLLVRARDVDRLGTGPPPCWQFSVIRC